MFPYVIEELSRAAMQEKEHEARKARRSSRARYERSHVRRFVARTLVHAGLHLDPRAGSLASRHADEGY